MYYLIYTVASLADRERGISRSWWYTQTICMERFTLHFFKDKFTDGVLVQFVVSFSSAPDD